MNGAFTDQILSEKLAKLNNSQQSIETLSHWCIFHRKRAAQVVQRWEKDFKASVQPRKVPFLYLANDILQNSRRKGPEFVNEFWKALPSALQDLVENGDDNTRSTVNRLISIWEERKVFGARDQTLKEAFLEGSEGEGEKEKEREKKGGITRSNSKGKDKSSGGGTSPGGKEQGIQSQLSGPLEKIAAAHAAVQELASDEESALRKCSAAINDLQALEKQSPLRIAAGPGGTAAVAEELQSKQGTLAKWTNQLEICEKKRSTLVNLLREALRTQESKLERIRSQVQIAQAQAEHAVSVRHKILTSDGRPDSGAAVTLNGTATPNASVTEEHQAAAPAEPQDPAWPVSMADQGNPVLNPEMTVESVQLGFTMEENREQVPHSQPTHTPMLEPPSNFQQNGFSSDVSEQERERFAGSVAPTEEEAKKKQEAADLAAKLAASSSSVAMLSSALSSLAAEGGLPLGLGLGSGRQTGGDGDFRTDKRPRLESPSGPPGMYSMGPSEGGGGGGQFSQPPMPTTMYMTNQPPQMMNGLPYMNYRQAAPPQRMGMPPPPLPHLPPPMQSPPPPPGFGPNYSSPFYAHQVAPPAMAPHPPSMSSPLMPRPPASV